MPEPRTAVRRTVEGQLTLAASAGEATRPIIEAAFGDVVRDLAITALGGLTLASARRLSAQAQGRMAQAQDALGKALRLRLRQAWEQGAASVDAVIEEARGLRAGNAYFSHSGKSEGMTGAEITVGGYRLPEEVYQALEELSLGYIKGLTDEAYAKVHTAIMRGVLGGTPTDTVAREIGGVLDSPGIYASISERAYNIARQEAGRVWSRSQQLRMSRLGRDVEGLEKMWLHNGHPRVPRSTHLAADRQHVPVDQPFRVGGYEIEYPRSGPPSESINCTCSMVPYKPEWYQ